MKSLLPSSKAWDPTSLDARVCAANELSSLGSPAKKFQKTKRPNAKCAANATKVDATFSNPLKKDKHPRPEAKGKFTKWNSKTKKQFVNLMKAMMENNAHGSDSDSSNSSASHWKKGTTKAEQAFAMGAKAQMDSDSNKSSPDVETCKKPVKKFCRSQKKGEKSQK